MKERSTIFWKCRNEAFENESLMPIDCIEILQKHYGKKLEHMKPKTIEKLISSLMHTQTDTHYQKEIYAIVQNYCNEC